MSELFSEQENLDRRTAMKKAAGAAGVAAGVWVAPRIEGLSLIPNYASAASPNITTETHMQTNCPDPGIGFSNQCWGGCGAGDACVSASTMYTVGDTTATVTFEGRADAGADGSFSIDPADGCTFTAVNGQSPGPGPLGQDVAGVGTTILNIDQSPVNQGNNVSFTITC